MRLRGIKLITFDATNTLLKFRVPSWKYYSLVGKEHGYSGTSDTLKRRMLESYRVMWKQHPNFGKGTISWEEWWRRVVKSTFEGQLPATADVNSIARRLINEFRTKKCWEPQEGAEKMLELLKSTRVRIGVISNFDPRLNEVLKDIGLDSNIDFVVTSYEVGYSKPDRRIFDEALKSCPYPVKGQECLHVGDDVEKDYEGARGAGWHALVVNRECANETPPAQDHVFTSLLSLTIAIESGKLKL